ncbi:MAG TPA: helix-turn-helix domain-containing protein [Solirubrobacterales bacterium]|nr:helix-turn-helix domain-containing protein [Solirubrobacterales bacterium]
MKRVTEGGRVYGTLVANQRERLGLSQRELAARVRTSVATIERIEDGHPPGAELRQRLSDNLFPEPARNPVQIFPEPARNPVQRLSDNLFPEPARNPVRRLASSHPIDRLVQGVAPRKRVAALRVPGNRRLWGAVGAAVLFGLLLIAGARIFSGGDGAPSLQPLQAVSVQSSVAVSHTIGAPATIHHARVEAQKAAVAKARREAAARRARAREQAAAAAAAARKRAAKQAASTNGSSSTTSPPVAAPVSPSPSPSGGAGGGGSSAPAPELGHGIGSG